MTIMGRGQGRSTSVPVQSWMSDQPRVCHPQDSLDQAIRSFWDGDCGMVPVVSEHSSGLLGVLTDRDACIAMWSRGESAARVPVESVMTLDVVSVRAEDSVGRAHELMREHRVRRLPVLGAEGQIVGILSLSDLARRATELPAEDRTRVSREIAETFAAVCGGPSEPCPAEEPLLLTR
ncbi:MAG: CBS domain-containing protein [Planctomycetota bacterium]